MREDSHGGDEGGPGRHAAGARCRALALRAPGEAAQAPSGASAPAYRADAAFLAHLLAVRNQVPSQRAKRRAAPEVGAAAYRSGLGLLAQAPRGMPGREA